MAGLARAAVSRAFSTIDVYRLTIPVNTASCTIPYLLIASALEMERKKRKKKKQIKNRFNQS